MRILESLIWLPKSGLDTNPFSKMRRSIRGVAEAMAGLSEPGSGDKHRRGAFDPSDLSEDDELAVPHLREGQQQEVCVASCLLA